MDAERHSLDLNGDRTISVVLVDVGTGIVACGVQLAVYAFGADVDGALENFVSACKETYEGACEVHNVDFAAVYGRGQPYFLGAGYLPREERVIPDSIFGSDIAGHA